MKSPVKEIRHFIKYLPKHKNIISLEVFSDRRHNLDKLSCKQLSQNFEKIYRFRSQLTIVTK